MNINLVKRFYPPHITSKLNQYSNSLKKLASIVNKIKFLKHCSHNNIIPNTISHILDDYKHLHRFPRFVNEKHRFLYQLIKRQIDYLYFEKQHLNAVINELFNFLVNNIHITHFECVYDHFSIYYKNMNSVIKTKHLQKIELLQTKILDGFTFDHSWLINRTPLIIPHNILFCLSLSPTFNINRNNNIKSRVMSLLDTIAIIESKLQNKSDAAVIQVRNKLQTFVNSQLASSGNKHFSSETFISHYISKLFKDAKNFLSSNPDLMLINSDKGNNTVLMYKQEYSMFGIEHLSDPKLYLSSSKSPLLSLVKKNNSLVRKLHTQNLIDDKQRDHLLSSHSSLAEIYFLPKIHKPNFGIRPIVSYINYPTYSLSKFISDPLKAALDAKFSLLNSFQLVEDLRSVHTRPDDLLYSFDIDNMYNSVPVETAILAVKRKWKFIKRHTTIPQKLFIEIFQLCLSGTHFTSTLSPNVFYTQKFGLSQGSVLAPIASNYVLDMLFNDTFKSQPSLKPSFIKYYVDDIFLITSSHISDKLLQTFNSFNPNIKFTSEIEIDGQIEFLDIVVMRSSSADPSPNDQQCCLSTKWHQKVYRSSRMLNYFSYHDHGMKYSILYNLVFRALRLTSPQHRIEVINHLRFISNTNNYPTKLFNTILKNATTKIYNSTSIRCDVSTPSFISLPFSHQFPSNLRHALNLCNVRPVFSYNSQIRSLYTHLKKEKDLLAASGVVYKLDCSSCDSSYVGSTTRPLNNRLYQHRYDLRVGNISTKLQEHSIHNDHLFDFQHPSILGRSRNTHTLLSLENCFIRSTHNVNHSNTQDPLSLYYSPLFDFVKHRKLFR